MARKKAFVRRKSCMFCLDEDAVIDYKNVVRLKKFVTERGKMVPRYVSGNCSKHQRSLSTAIKRARIVALLPFVAK
ncbi:30S ribosomal protein S18 [PVC group bacterium (ex Bugula neritina AB1)]|nr:30S ribosomal protein S18 [PVC group bacterium (ex Bugula neritina AB1)]